MTTVERPTNLNKKDIMVQDQPYLVESPIKRDRGEFTRDSSEGRPGNDFILSAFDVRQQLQMQSTAGSGFGVQYEPRPQQNFDK